MFGISIEEFFAVPNSKITVKKNIKGEIPDVHRIGLFTQKHDCPCDIKKARAHSLTAVDHTLWVSKSENIAFHSYHQ